MHTTGRRGPNDQFQSFPASGPAAHGQGMRGGHPPTAANPASMHPRSTLQGPAPSTAGPHRSDLVNKLDPTVDSQDEGIQVLGPGINSSTQGRGPAPRTTTAAHHTHPAVGNNYGPAHNSRLANELDPRVGTTQGRDAMPHYSTAAAPPQVGAPAVPPPNVPEGTYAPHSTRLGNAVDPRVDSDFDSRTRAPIHGQNTTIHEGPTVQPGPASHTAGPHHSNIMNKLDPTVNSKATITQQREYRTA